MSPEAVLRKLPASFPGSALLGQGQASHPVDQIWCAVLDEKLTRSWKQVNCKNFGEDLRSRLQSARTICRHHGQQSGRQKEELARVEQGIEPLCKQIRDTGVHLQSIERRLDAGSKETDEGMTAIRHDIAGRSHGG